MKASDYNFKGGITVEGETHAVEYEPSAMVGASTLFLRIKGSHTNVPIYVEHIDEVIDMLNRGKKVIEAYEGE